MTNEEQIKSLALMIQKLATGEGKKITGNLPPAKKQSERFAKFQRLYATKNLKYVHPSNS